MSRAGLEEFVLRIIERYQAGRYSERHGLVTSYDPQHHMAKVAFQPEGQELGWLPIETGHIGQGYGIAIGLQPGNGGNQQASTGSSSGGSGTTSQATGDQVIVRYQEGDFESGKIVQRVHSDSDTPPVVQSGEIVIWTKFKKDASPGPDAAQTGQSGSQGQKLYFKNDGSFSYTDGNGATLTFDGKGNATLSAKSVTWNIQNAITLNGQTINLVGNVHLGSKGGVPAAMQGTVDTAGNADETNLATKVWIT